MFKPNLNNMIFISGRVTPADVTNLEMEKSDAKNGTVAINGSSLPDKGDNGSNGKSEDEKKKEKEEVKLVGFFEVVGKLFAPAKFFMFFIVCGRVPWLYQYWPGGFMLFVVLCPRMPEGSTGSGSGFKASQKTRQQLKVSSDRLGEAGNRTCHPWFTRY